MRELLAIARRVADCVAERDLLSYASAIAFQAFFALIPMALAALSVLGFLGLESVWTNDVRPTVSDRLPDDAFAVVERTVDTILGGQRVAWLTFGLAFTLWQLSGAIRATTGPLNMVYGVQEDRSWIRRTLSSIGLAVAISPCLLLALLGVTLGDQLIGALDFPAGLTAFTFVARWLVAIALMLVAIWLLLRFGPAHSPGWRWASLGSGFVVVGWVGTSVVYGVYVTQIASYGSLFAGLASLIVLMTYVYILALVFLIGVQLDAVLRERARDGGRAANAS